ncbi:granulocyte colony-stimulating factor-like [Centroberyx gerrardi]|uniref:granulocyte colony-stimulating factor-like n=1 Tax=Centroberyx gerrardi TaxID=166262 RepID=UPI003AABBE1D
MNPLHFLALHCCLAVLVRSAPLPDSSSAGMNLEFKQAAERAKTLVEKILRDIPTVHGATVNIQGLTLDPSSQPANLQMMETSLGIPAAPVLKPLSESFTLALCVNRMSVGTKLHQDLLGALADKLTGLTDLRSDLRDLLTQISKMQELGQLSSAEQYQSPDLASRLNGNYEVQVANHLTLKQLRSFCHDLIRSLRHIATHKP